ncbi:uncharacterized protein LOC114315213 [Camellia sinensis]|uniref:uncharacterized protein LOC114315213 n=1 Tax=Camellia sinensis TaxID=4442 RepID=UPI0010357937|nr:uncharacterized protein LOC114315213 [Camellia sinensis]
MEDEGENYPMEYHVVNQNRITVYLTPEKEAFHRIASEGWIEEVNLKIQPWRQIKVRQEKHMLFAVATQTIVTEASSQLIIAKIAKHEYPEWLLSAVYASPVHSKREELWNSLENIAQTTSAPWMIAGDFNDFASQEEKRSFSSNTTLTHWNNLALYTISSEENSDLMIDVINEEVWKAVKNIKAIKAPGKVGGMILKIDLEKAYDNISWAFLEQTLEESCFNKKLIDLIMCCVTTVNMAILWNGKPLEEFKPEKRKRWLLGRIDGIQKSQANIYSHNLHVLEMNLIDQYNKVLYQEEILWFQKSRSKWITQGDKNTKFFHLLTLTKKRKKKIDVLKGQDGVWVERPEDLKMLVTNYLTNLFTQSSNTTLTHWNNLALYTISSEENSDLMIDVINEEVWKAVKNIKAIKAPGRDGFQAIFYHTYW